MMTAHEFIELAKLRGVSDKRTASRFVANSNRVEFSENDLSALDRFIDRCERENIRRCGLEHYNEFSMNPAGEPGLYEKDLEAFEEEERKARLNPPRRRRYRRR